MVKKLLTIECLLKRAVKQLALQHFELYDPYQLNGVRWLLKREFNKKIKGGLLCDEMGLGKTIQMVSLIIANQVPNTLLIVPSNLINQWISEINKFTNNQIQIIIHHGNNRITNDNVLKSKLPKIIITSYGLMARYPTSIIHNVKWDRIILEECHIIRNNKSKTSKSIYRLNSKY